MANVTLRGGVGARVDAEIAVKRSRFVCRLERVSSEDEARAAISDARKTHPSARHHCSAFVISSTESSGETRRSNDDGEPSGTAGRPMLDALVGRGLTDGVAIVSRYFGGTLLGAGGLTRAYSDAVLTAIDAAQSDGALIARERRSLFSLALAHADAGRVEAELRQRGVAVLGTEYGQRATLHLAGSADLHDIVAAVTAGKNAAEGAGDEWVDVELPS